MSAIRLGYLSPKCKKAALFGRTGLRADSGDLTRDGAIPIVEQIIVIINQGNPQIDGLAGLSEVVGNARKDGPVYLFLNAVQGFIITLMPAVNDNARSIRGNP
jgi:hypothetical protein